MKILYQDNHYIAVHKPARLLVHRTQMDAAETKACVQLLRDQVGQLVYPCHRLDKATSGVILFALDKEALKAANDAFAGGAVEKTYLAVVRGWMIEPGCLDYPLAIEDVDTGKKGIVKVQDAVTTYRPIESFEINVSLGRYKSARFTLVELCPKTGRRHQLRRHMAHLRHPIIGDTCHGDGLQNRFFREHFNCRRLLLVAVRLRFRHPISGETLVIESHSNVATGLYKQMDKLIGPDGPFGI